MRSAAFLQYKHDHKGNLNAMVTCDGNYVIEITRANSGRTTDNQLHTAEGIGKRPRPGCQRSNASTLPFLSMTGASTAYRTSVTTALFLYGPRERWPASWPLTTQTLR